MKIDKPLIRSSHSWQVEPCDPAELKQVMTRWQRELEGRSWNWVGQANHNQKRAFQGSTMNSTPQNRELFHKGERSPSRNRLISEGL
jgi:hypothetical protein